MDIRGHNRASWDRLVKDGNRWTVPVDSRVIARARRGDWQLLLTPTKPVPGDWFPPLKDLDVLCLASGGGQQAPVLAAAGAKVTVLDNSPAQLAQDRMVAERDSLALTTIEGDMADLSMFPDESFGLVFHPVSNSFVPDVRPVWREAFRVLRKGGILLAGFANPAIYLFDYDLAESQGILQVKYALPYSDLVNLDAAARRQLLDSGEPIEFSHSLADQIGGQLDAGFVLTGCYEDAYAPEENDLLSSFMPCFLATRGVKG